MNFSFYRDGLLELQTDLLALACFEAKVHDVKELNELDRALDGLVSQLVSEEEFAGRRDQTLALHTHGRVGPRRVLLVGLGKREEFDVPDTRRYGAEVARQAHAHRLSQIAGLLPPVDPSAAEPASRFFAEGVCLGAYRFDRYRAEDDRRPSKVKQVQVVLPKGQNPPHLALSRGEILAKSVNFARDLTNTPAADLTPNALAEIARGLAKDTGCEFKVLGPKECEKQKMGLFLAVSRASSEEPRFIHLTYRPKGKEKASRRVVLVGKGVTFDSGGLSLKPTSGMLDMKADMAGAAAVLGAMSAVPSLGLKCEVHALVAATENMISGSAYKLGDIITGMSGKTVEIVNTDAEGRLTLADALAYAVKLHPDEIIDLATLTGACVVALGPHIGGVMSNDQALAERMLAAARQAGEEAWRLPLSRSVRKQLDSPLADLKNAGDRWGGAITAGLFLKEFVDDTSWIHIDIAGPAVADKGWELGPEGGTGYGVATVLQYLLMRDS